MGLPWDATWRTGSALALLTSGVPAETARVAPLCLARWARVPGGRATWARCFQSTCGQLHRAGTLVRRRGCPSVADVCTAGCQDAACGLAVVRPAGGADLTDTPRDRWRFTREHDYGPMSNESGEQLNTALGNPEVGGTLLTAR
jgi:hypothetical protein